MCIYLCTYIIQCYSHQIGSTHTEFGFHGYIAIIVFIHDVLLRSNLVSVADLVDQLKDKRNQQVALGKNLGVARASNKGGVSINMPLNLQKLGYAENSCLTFISCHLTSDASGVSKVDKRNQDASEMIRELSLG